MINDINACRQATFFVDSDHPAIIALAASLVTADQSDLQKAVALYYWTRDQIRYNPYAVGTTRDDYKASAIAASGEGWCVPKAVLLAALCRACGIPARLGYADVRNHLSTANMRAAMQTDVFYYHGYTSIFLEGSWVKATPAFNVELCEKFGLHPLEFNGLEDSLYHEFDRAGNRHMEYLHERGEFLDIPFDDMLALFREHYPGLLPNSTDTPDQMPDPADWEEDVAREVGSS